MDEHLNTKHGCPFRMDGSGCADFRVDRCWNHHMRDIYWVGVRVHTVYLKRALHVNLCTKRYRKPPI